jgi:hypothetical protein
MGGPSSVIYTSCALDRESLTKIVNARAASSDGNGGYWFDDTVSFGGRFKGDARPFVIGLVPLYGDEQEESQVAAFLGGCPERVEVGAMCNGDEDWIVIVDVVAWLAEAIGGSVVLPSRLIETPRCGRATVITTGEGHDYSLVDAEAFRESASWGIAVVEK